MLRSVVGDLEQRIRSQPPKPTRIRFDPARVDKQCRRHALASQRFDQFCVIAAARVAAACVQGESNDSVFVGSRDTTPGTASPQALGRLPEYRRIRAFLDVRSVPAGRVGPGARSAEAVASLVAAAELAGGVGSGCAVAAGSGAPPERLSAGLQARTVQETVASRESPALDVQPDPRVLVFDRRSCCSTASD